MGIITRTDLAPTAASLMALTRHTYLVPAATPVSVNELASLPVPSQVRAQASNSCRPQGLDRSEFGSVRLPHLSMHLCLPFSLPENPSFRAALLTVTASASPPGPALPG